MIKHINSCPIGKELVDENVVRLNAFLTILILISGWFFPLIWFLLLIDFILRIKITKFSPVARFSKLIIHNLLKLKPKPINAKPKLFAAKIGLVFNLLLILSLLFDWPSFKLVTLGFFLIAAGLESFFNYCLGCKIYQIIINLQIINSNEPSIAKINHQAKRR